MLSFPNCKINLGLKVLRKRLDGYHDIDTAFYPVGWCDALEILDDDSAPRGSVTMELSGIPIEGTPSENLVYRAARRISDAYNLPAFRIHLHKNIPMGAGLGGGSADAAFIIRMLDEKYSLGISMEEKLAFASELGSDCAFFIENRPLIGHGRGSEFSQVSIDLSPYFILLVYPGIHSDTREAYTGIMPAAAERTVGEILGSEPPERWKNHLVNDFEASVFKKYPLIGSLKAAMYAQGALYASMSGSGSAVYGVFSTEPDLLPFKHYPQFLQRPSQNC